MGNFPSQLQRLWEDLIFPVRMRLGTKIMWDSQRKIVIAAFPTELIKSPCSRQELDAMRYVARSTSVTLPLLHRTYTRLDGIYIAMEFVIGDRLDRVWGHLDDHGKRNVIELIHQELQKLHNRSPPAEVDVVVASIGLGAVKDGSVSQAPTGPCHQLEDFEKLIAAAPALQEYHPLIARLKKCKLNSTVLVHGDIAARNIILRQKDGLPVLIDWEVAGWWPEYWECVKYHFSDFPELPGWTRLMDEVAGLE